MIPFTDRGCRKRQRPAGKLEEKLEGKPEERPEEKHAGLP